MSSDPRNKKRKEASTARRERLEARTRAREDKPAAGAEEETPSGPARKRRAIAQQATQPTALLATIQPPPVAVRAATRIQALYRCWTSQSRFTASKVSATTLQALVRSRIAQRRFSAVKDAAQRQPAATDEEQQAKLKEGILALTEANKKVLKSLGVQPVASRTHFMLPRLRELVEPLSSAVGQKKKRKKAVEFLAFVEEWTLRNDEFILGTFKHFMRVNGGTWIGRDRVQRMCAVLEMAKELVNRVDDCKDCPNERDRRASIRAKIYHLGELAKARETLPNPESGHWRPTTENQNLFLDFVPAPYATFDWEKLPPEKLVCGYNANDVDELVLHFKAIYDTTKVVSQEQVDALHSLMVIIEEEVLNEEFKNESYRLLKKGRSDINAVRKECGSKGKVWGRIKANIDYLKGKGSKTAPGLCTQAFSQARPKTSNAQSNDSNHSLPLDQFQLKKCEMSHSDLGLVGKSVGDNQRNCLAIATFNAHQILGVNIPFQNLVDVFQENAPVAQLMKFVKDQRKVTCQEVDLKLPGPKAILNEGHPGLKNCLLRCQDSFGVYIWMLKLRFQGGSTTDHALCYHSSTDPLVIDEDGIWRIHGHIGKGRKLSTLRKAFGDLVTTPGCIDWELTNCYKLEHV